jgi:alpha-L-fucosidase 2
MRNPIALIACVVAILSCIASARAEMKTDIAYGKPGDADLKLDASIPDGTGPFPVVIIVHGGGWESGDKQKDITPLFGPLTDASFTWFSINYRLAPANRWPACLEDTQTAIRWVKAHAGEYKGDPNRIALIGHSAGGQLVCMAAEVADESTRVQAVIGLAPATDFEFDLAQRGGLSKALQDLLDRPQAPTDESLQLLRDIAPINHVKAGLPPFLLIQGSADKTVQYQQTLNFRTKLKATGDACDLITLEGAPHRVTLWDQFDPSYKEKMVKWLKETLVAPATTQPAH